MTERKLVKIRKSVCAWLLTIAMAASLAVVPQETVNAAEQNLTVKGGNSGTVTMAKNAYGNDIIGDVEFTSPVTAKAGLQNASMEVTCTVTDFTAGDSSEAPSAMLFAQPGEDGGWEWNQSDGVNLSKGNSFTLTYKFSAMNWNGGSTLGKLGMRFANCKEGTNVSYNITSAKLITSDGAGGSGDFSGGVDTSEVSVIRKQASGANNDYHEWMFSITNHTSDEIEGVKIVIPTSSQVSSISSYGFASAAYDAEVSGILIYYSKKIGAGQTVEASEDLKIGYSSNGVTVGESYVLDYNCEPPSGSGTSGTDLKYELTGQVKDVEYEDTPVGKHGALHLADVDGYSAPIIVDKNGAPFQLRGASTHGLHWDEMHPYVNKGAFQSLRDEWGVNMVRLVSYVTQGGYTQGKKELLDTKIQEGVEYAKELGMYVIIDWHIHEEDPHNTIEQAKEFFRTYAAKYKDYDNVIFEICNEPIGVQWYNGSGKDLYTYCKSITEIIRNECKNDSLIVCGTNTWSQDVEDVSKKPLKDDGFEDILYTFHFYAATHYDNLMQKVKNATAAGTPIFVTEFGVCSANGNGTYDTDNATAWINLCDEYNISYSCWSMCNKPEAASYFQPSCNKQQGGWVGSDLTTTGIWLVNTYRAHQDKENNTDTTIGEFSVSISSPESGRLEDVKEGYKSAGAYVIKIENTGNKDISGLKAELKKGTDFEITSALSVEALKPSQSATLSVSLKTGKAKGSYSDTVQVTAGGISRSVSVKQTVAAESGEQSEEDEKIDPYTVDLSKLDNDGYVSKHIVTGSDGTKKPTVSYDKDKKVLTLLEKEGKYTITGSNPDVKIVCAENADNTEVTLKDASVGSIEAPKVNIKDDGQVTVKDDIKAGDIDISGSSANKVTVEGSVVTTGNVTISGGTVDVKKGIEAGKDVNITGGNITVVGKEDHSAISAKGDVNLTGGSINATAGSSTTGEQKPAIETTTDSGKIVLDGATVTGQDPDNLYSKDAVDLKGDKVETKNKAASFKLYAKVKGVSSIPVGSTYKLAAGKSMQLSAAFSPEEAEAEKLGYKSSKPSIVKVNSSGKVTAGKKAGKASITVTSENGLTKKFTVKVMKKAVKSISIKGKKILKVKKKLKLKATVKPAKNRASNVLVWKTGNANIATVSSKGVVKAKKKGRVKITVIATDGSGKKATVIIKVK